MTTACWACGADTRPATEVSWATVERCDSCGLLLQPDRSPTDVHELYDASYFSDYPGGGAYDEDERSRRYEAALRVRFLRRFVRSGRLLEIGAATGHFLAAARAGGFDVLGVEPSVEAAEHARERYDVDVITGFAEAVEFEPNSFDVVCAWHVVEHIPEPLRVLIRIAHIIRGGGVLAVEVPNIESVQARRLGDAWPHLDVDHHVAHYGPDSMRRLIKRSGLEVVEVETFPGTGYFPPGQALRPATLAGYARELLAVRALPRRSHASKHELLRVVARVPRSAR